MADKLCPHLYFCGIFVLLQINKSNTEIGAGQDKVAKPVLAANSLLTLLSSMYLADRVYNTMSAAEL